jgi:hypothetical protein
MCKTGGRYLPTFALWKPFSECLPVVCITSHDGGESAAVWLHWFLFPSGEICCQNIWNAASSFRRVLPNLIRDIWVVFPFQKWTLILWRRPLPRQAVHLPHCGDRGTCARHLRWPTTDYQRGCRGRTAFSTCQKILTKICKWDVWQRNLCPISWRRNRRMIICHFTLTPVIEPKTISTSCPV